MYNFYFLDLLHFPLNYHNDNIHTTATTMMMTTMAIEVRFTTSFHSISFDFAKRNGTDERTDGRTDGRSDG